MVFPTINHEFIGNLLGNHDSGNHFDHGSTCALAGGHRIVRRFVRAWQPQFVQLLCIF